jgi:hypothetical protein
MKRILTLVMIPSLLLAGGDDDGFFMGKKGVRAAKDLVDHTIKQVPKVAGDAGSEFGKKAVQSAKEEIGNQAYKGREFLLAGGAALLATPLAKFIIVGGLGLMATGATVKATQDYKVKGFKRCMNRHFTGALNDRGFPQECEEREVNCQWWDQDQTTSAIEHFRTQKRLSQKITQ